jgi:hypothetical protein
MCSFRQKFCLQNDDVQGDLAVINLVEVQIFLLFARITQALLVYNMACAEACYSICEARLASIEKLRLSMARSHA